jgi:leader peptidase (prepilin peptidase)/N-methyltransferase
MNFFIFLFGLLVGSFLNCLVYRLNQEDNLKSFLKGRSYCPKCRRTLAWFDNLPLLSFCLLKGRCRQCHSSISFQYPLSELFTGIFSLLVWRLSGQAITFGFFFNLFFLYVLIAIFLSDLNYRTIPDQITYPALTISLFFILFDKAYLNILTGLVSAGFFLVLFLITKQKGIGFGDMKLAGLMGLVLGFPKTIVAFYLAFLTGACLGAILVLIKKKKFKSEISFGPFLAVATFIALFWGERIWQAFL